MKDLTRLFILFAFLMLSLPQARAQFGDEIEVEDNAPIIIQPADGDVCESVIAAIYLDSGFDAARDFIERNWRARMLDSTSALGTNLYLSARSSQ